MFRGFILSLMVSLVLGENVPIETWQFTQVGPQGYGPAVAVAAPMWHLPSGTCMPSAAEDDNGQQTHGVSADHCNIAKLSSGCSPQPDWYGPGTLYNNVDGEPFVDIPTYFKVAECPDDQSWRVLYSVYFKKDTGHKSDWEHAMVTWKSADGGNWWFRDNIRLGRHKEKHQFGWQDIPNTFNGNNDLHINGVRNGAHPKLYFGKWHHGVYENMQTSLWKNTCPPNNDDFCNDDFYFLASSNLRNAADESILDPWWDWGAASSPANADVCKWGN